TLYISFFFSSRRRHTRSKRDWSSDVCSSDLPLPQIEPDLREYYANLRDAIDGKAEPIVKTSQVRSVFRVLEAAFESAKTGKQIQIGRASCRERGKRWGGVERGERAKVCNGNY